MAKMESFNNKKTGVENKEGKEINENAKKAASSSVSLLQKFKNNLKRSAILFGAGAISMSGNAQNTNPNRQADEIYANGGNRTEMVQKKKVVGEITPDGNAVEIKQIKQKGKRKTVITNMGTVELIDRVVPGQAKSIEKNIPQQEIQEDAVENNNVNQEGLAPLRPDLVEKYGLKILMRGKQAMVVYKDGTPYKGEYGHPFQDGTVKEKDKKLVSNNQDNNSPSPNINSNGPKLKPGYRINEKNQIVDKDGKPATSDPFIR